MTQIKLDNTSEQDLRSLLPELEGPDGSDCEAGTVSSKIYNISIGDVGRGALSRVVETLDRYNRPALAILYLLGHRFHRFGAYAHTCAGKVVSLEYFVWIDDNHDHNMFEGTEVAVSGYSRTGWLYSRNYSDGFTYEEEQPYVERVASNAPKKQPQPNLHNGSTYRFCPRCIRPALGLPAEFRGLHGHKTVTPRYLAAEICLATQKILEPS